MGTLQFLLLSRIVMVAMFQAHVATSYHQTCCLLRVSADFCMALQSKFRGASTVLVAAADCNGLTAGIESAAYEGPLRVRIPVRLSPAAASDGGWSFEVPLPDPASQKLLGRWGAYLGAA